MERARQFHHVSVEDYLAAELDSPVKHEYVDGVVYQMAGARNTHNLIGGNAFLALGSRLRGTPCRVYNSDTKIRLRLPHQVRFYYPDLSVICRPNPGSDTFQDEPAVIVEVISGRTRRLDEGEKKEGYLKLPSLSAYLLVEQETPVVVLFRRTDLGFVRELHQGMDAVIPLPELGVELPLVEIYEGAELTPDEDQ